MSGNKKDKKKTEKKKMPIVKKAPVPGVPAEWLYMNPEVISARQIYELFAEDPAYRAEFWEEIAVLEIGIPEAGSVDMEEIECEFDDEEGQAFLAQNQIKTVYEVTIMPEHYEKAKAAMQIIAENLGGFFCGDTEDFQPMLRM